MNMNKILAAGLIAATSFSSVEATQCGNGGFYMGASLGASFNKATAKFDKDSISAKFSGIAKALQDKILVNAAEVAKAETAVKEQAAVVLTEMVKLFTDDAGLPALADMAVAFTNTTKGIAGSFASLVAAPGVVHPANASSALYKLVKFLSDNDPSLADNPLFKNNVAETLTPAQLTELFKTSVESAVQSGKLTTLSGLFTYPTGQELYDRAAASAAAAHVNTAQNAGLTAAQTTAVTAAYTPYKAAIEALESVVATYRSTVATSKDADLVKLFYKAEDKKAALDAETVASNLVSYSTGLADKELAELGVNAKNIASKKATGFLFELMFGFDHRINDVMLGVELAGGMECGGKVKIKDKKALKGSDGITVRRQFYVSLMPRIGYLVAPQFEVFATFGGSLGKYKSDTKHMMTIFDNAKPIVDMAIAYSKTTGLKDADKIDVTVNQTEAAKVFKSHSKTRFVPVIGAGVRYEITPEMFATLAYNYAFKTKVADAKKAGVEIKFQSHIVKAGVGFRF